MKAMKFGTLIKVRYLILLNIFSAFPTYVGMFLQTSISVNSTTGLPHICGDVPDRTAPALSCNRVFPTHVGMFPEASPLPVF